MRPSANPANRQAAAQKHAVRALGAAGEAVCAVVAAAVRAMASCGGARLIDLERKRNDNARFAASTAVPLVRKGQRMLTATEHTLVRDAFQHGDTSRLPAFLKAKTARAKKIAKHVTNFARLKALYDETPDGEVEAVCSEMEAEEDWMHAQLRW
jgi:hypothetical protein